MQELDTNDVAGWTRSLGPVVPDTKGRALHAALREGILSGTIRPGSHLNARELARELGVSAIPVREALHRLAAEGLVIIRPHVGAFVAELPAEELAAYLEIRLLLESLALEKAIERLHEADVAVLDRLLEELDADLQAENWTAYARDNRKFHRTIYGFCGSEVLLSEIDRLFALSERGRALFALDPTNAERSQAEHRELMGAIRARDTSRAKVMMAGHRRRNLEGLRRVTAHGHDPADGRAELEESS